MMKNFFYFCLGLLISVGLFFVPYANAQTSHVDPAFNRTLNAIISNTPGVTTQAFPSGVTVSGSGTSTVTTPSGLRIPIPSTTTANVSKAAISKAVAQATKLGRLAIPGAGWAITGWAIYEAWEESGLGICPPPDFFCAPEKPGIAGDQPGTGYYYNQRAHLTRKTPAQACQAYAESVVSGTYPAKIELVGSKCSVYIEIDGRRLDQYNNLPVTKVAKHYVPTSAPIPDAEIEAAVKKKTRL